MNRLPHVHLLPALRGKPAAQACISGSENFPGITGWVRFYQTDHGVMVYAEVTGLPLPSQPCQGGIFGFHIHQGSDCGGSGEEPFPHAMSHYNPGDCAHPYHAGDLPPLFGNHGLAVSAFLTDRFLVDDVIGKVVILHGHPDDFTTQPAGNAGAKIACGVIQRVEGFCG
ncbi:superoxide dismutase family protein [Acutalibacter caecimuris]|uniref:superoxide dismutase family protein n=1 Tax=Acutalibacter caecimuris TaxID=3093657 RepID=UPI002AC89502|nr:superoxide dismutase family protein [Acutalibacter sp. M00118]